MTEQDPLEAARKARAEAEARQREAESQWPLIRVMMHRLRFERHENHFSERMRDAFGRGT